MTLFSPPAHEADRKLMEGYTASAPVSTVTEGADAYMRRLEILTLNGKRRPIGAPNPDRLARHIKLYGNEGVEEVTRAFPVDSMPLAAYRTEAPSGRRLSEETKRVILTFAPTHPVSAIANILNLSERRVNELLASSA